jgi:hypothetical protein
MEKELTRLWYEYLKRSDSYREFIKKNRPITKALRNPATLSQIWDLHGKDPVLHGLTLNLHKFGDVFKVTFEKWYGREHEPWAAMDTKIYLRWFELQLNLSDEASCKSLGLPYLPGKSVYEFPNQLRSIFEETGRSVVNISVNTNASDKEIRDAVSRIVKQHKKKMIPALESLQDYLYTYDLFQEPGRSELDIAKKIFPKSVGENLSHNETINRIRLYKKNACTIIRNVEQGDIYFPGQY